jgi:hypothetical protein
MACISFVCPFVYRYINQDGYSQNPSIAGIGVAVIFRSGAPEWDYDVSHETRL